MPMNAREGRGGSVCAAVQEGDGGEGGGGRVQDRRERDGGGGGGVRGKGRGSVCAERRGVDLVEAERLRWARDRSVRVDRARASTTGGVEATVAAGVAEAALAAAAATAAGAGDLGTCGEMAGQAACVRAGAGGQRVVHKEGGGGKDGDSSAASYPPNLGRTPPSMASFKSR